jgi:hypothetical protein
VIEAVEVERKDDQVPEKSKAGANVMITILLRFGHCSNPTTTGYNASDVKSYSKTSSQTPF